jgi:hypothetical protein
MRPNRLCVPAPALSTPRARTHPRSAATAAALLLGLCSLAGTAAAAGYSPEALLITSDFSAKIRVMDPARKTIVYDYVPAQESLESCNQSGFGCTILGMHYLNQGGDDYLDMALYVSNSNTGVPKPDAAYSVIQRIRPTTPAQQVWRLRGLDFRDVKNGADYCTQDPADPCGAITDPRCEPQLVHEMHVISEQPDQKKVTVMLADLSNTRVEQVTLDYSNGNSCGHVDWVIGPKNPDWPGPAYPNAVQYIGGEAGGPYVMTTFYSATGEVNGGGLIQLWQFDGDDWHEAWRFPEERDGVGAFLNTPHMGEFLIDPATGKKWIGVSHSRGLSDAWRSYRDYAGGYILLQPGNTLADRPTYLFEAMIHPGTINESHFPRDIDFLEDGSLLLTDAATESGSVQKFTPRVFRVTPFYNGIQPSGKPGNYTPDHAQQNILNVPDANVIGEYECGYGSLFEADWVPAAKLGKTLKAAAASAKTLCPKRK